MRDDCPYCHTTAAGGGTRAVRCRGCGLYFFSPRMDAGAQRRFLATLTPSVSPPLVTTAYRREVAWLRCRATLTRVLDVGASTGGFALALREAGAEVTALEPVTACADAARAAGIDTLHGVFAPDAVEGVAPFTLVCWRECVCCFPDLPEAFAIARRLLVPGGTLYIRCHQARSIAYRGRAPHARRYGPAAQGLPTLGALRRILDREGFRVRHASTQTPAASVFDVLGWPRVARSRAGRVVNRALLSPLVRALGMGDRLVIIATTA